MLWSMLRASSAYCLICLNAPKPRTSKHSSFSPIIPRLALIFPSISAYILWLIPNLAFWQSSHRLATSSPSNDGSDSISISWVRLMSSSQCMGSSTTSRWKNLITSCDFLGAYWLRDSIVEINLRFRAQKYSQGNTLWLDSNYSTCIICPRARRHSGECSSRAMQSANSGHCTERALAILHMLTSTPLPSEYLMPASLGSNISVILCSLLQSRMIHRSSFHSCMTPAIILSRLLQIQYTSSSCSDSPLLSTFSAMSRYTSLMRINI